MMSKLDKTDLVSGLLLIAVGLCFAIGALDYRMGTVVRMGPGFVPFSLGLISIVLGIAVALTSLGREGGLPRLDWRTILPILVAIAVFALVLPRAGLIPAAILTVLVSSFASVPWRPLHILPLSIAVAVFVWIGFVLILGMPFPVIRSPF
jgi:hypothetical protein